MSAGERRPSDWAKKLRSAAAAVVVILGLVVLGFVLLKSPAGRENANVPLPTSQSKVDEKVRIRYVEFRGEREKVEFTADRSYIGPDDLYHMVGNVQIIDYGRRGSHRIVIRGEEIVHDTDRFQYTFVGPVTVDFRGMTLRTSDVVYDRREETFRTERRVDVRSPRVQGGAVGLSYGFRDYVLSLDDDLAFTLHEEQGGTPLSVSGRSLRFHQDTRKGEIEGPVSLGRGRSRGTCRRVDFEMFGGTDLLSIIYLKGEARLKLRGESLFPSGGDAGLGTLAELGADQDIESEEIKIRNFQDSSLLHSFETSGGASLQFFSKSGVRTRFRAERIDFIFDRWGGLREFRSFVGARMDQRDGGTGETRSVAGESMIMTGGSDWLLVRPGPEGKAQAALGQTDIQGDELDFGLEGRDLEARRVKVVFAGGNRDQSVGFFAPDRPSFVTAKEMRFISRDRRFIFRGDVRMWQEGKTLTAEELEFQEDTGRALGRGGVRAVFSHKPQNRENEERVDISAQTLESEPGENRMTFESNARLVLQRADIKARSIMVRLEEEGRQVEGITASGDVIILQGEKEGRGRLAVYDEERDEIVLTGRPVLFEKTRGRVEGDKLTFHLGDGTITVENAGRERSVTLIKS